MSKQTVNELKLHKFKKVPPTFSFHLDWLIEEASIQLKINASTQKWSFRYPKLSPPIKIFFHF